MDITIEFLVKRREHEIKTKPTDTIEKKEYKDQVKTSVTCDQCDSEFLKNYNLEQHIQKEHRGYQTFECDLCCKHFVTEWRLKKHSNMHSRTKIKICKYYKWIRLSKNIKWNTLLGMT